MSVRRLGPIFLAAALCMGAACSSDSTSSSEPTNLPASNDTTAGAGQAPTTVATGPGQTTPTAVALPDGWPSELALPAGVTPVEASDLTTQKSVRGNIAGDVQTVYDTLKQQLTDAGYEIVGSTFTPTDKGGYGSISARGTKYTAAIAFGPDPTGQVNQVDISVADAP